MEWEKGGVWMWAPQPGSRTLGVRFLSLAFLTSSVACAIIACECQSPWKQLLRGSCLRIWEIQLLGSPVSWLLPFSLGQNRSDSVLRYLCGSSSASESGGCSLHHGSHPGRWNQRKSGAEMSVSCITVSSCGLGFVDGRQHLLIRTSSVDFAKLTPGSVISTLYDALSFTRSDLWAQGEEYVLGTVRCGPTLPPQFLGS